jgi:small conductance mechanosensitive channel
MKLQIQIDYFTKYTNAVINVLIDYFPRLIAALVILFIGIWIIKIINKVAIKVMLKRKFEPTLIEFLSDILFWGLRIVLFIVVITKLGVESSSFVAILGAAGLAVGLSLQGSLSNFAGGMLIILFKPFKLGDSIEAQGVGGEVIDIQIFVTQLLTGNNQVIFLPNGALSNGTIINYSRNETRRTDLTISLSYETNINEARQLVLEVMKSNPKILKSPEPVVIVRDLTDNAIRLAIRAWTKNEDFGQVSSDLLENTKTAFDQKGIVVQPYTRESSKE